MNYFDYLGCPDGNSVTSMGVEHGMLDAKLAGKGTLLISRWLMSLVFMNNTKPISDRGKQKLNKGVSGIEQRDPNNLRNTKQNKTTTTKWLLF